METLLIILLVVFFLALLLLTAVIIWQASRLSRQGPNNEQIANLSGKLDAIQKQVDSNLKTVSDQVSVFGNVKETLGKVAEATDRVMKLGEDINKLQNILQSPNRRGGFGEILLGNLLSQVLPEKFFQLQYSFQDNTRVDAIIILGDHILPIDSKFPLDGFEGEQTNDVGQHQKPKSAFIRAVKERIDETAGYIRPAEHTFEFAMMYIPAENVYYEVISNVDLFNYAMQKRVIPASPNSFFAYLQVVVLVCGVCKLKKMPVLFLSAFLH